MATQRQNPYSNFNFIVVADGIGPLGAFSEISGLDSENTPIEYREGADAMTQRAANLKKLADASEPLYKSLDDAQKRRFAALIRMGGRDGHFHRHGHGPRRG